MASTTTFSAYKNAPSTSSTSSSQTQVQKNKKKTKAEAMGEAYERMFNDPFEMDTEEARQRDRRNEMKRLQEEYRYKPSTYSGEPPAAKEENQEKKKKWPKKKRYIHMTDEEKERKYGKKPPSEPEPLPTGSPWW